MPAESCKEGSGGSKGEERGGESEGRGRGSRPRTGRGRARQGAGTWSGPPPSSQSARSGLWEGTPLQGARRGHPELHPAPDGVGGMGG